MEAAVNTSTAVALLPPSFSLTGEVRWDNHTVRQLERGSIRDFMQRHRQYLKGRVLDFGAGKQPYRDLVDGEYVPYEKGENLPEGEFDALMCNQVVQYLPNPPLQISRFARMLRPGGYLAMTYPTNWDEVEQEDYWRLTRSGMERILGNAGFRILVHERRAEIDLGGFKFPLGYGVVAQSFRLRRTTLDPDESVAMLTEQLNRKQPFVFFKYGDGALECMYRLGECSRTCDGERYTAELAQELRWAWGELLRTPFAFVGDWLSASFGPDSPELYVDEYADLVDGASPTWVHFECVLLMRLAQPLLEFYRALAMDSRKKLLIGRPEMAGAAKMLRAGFLPIPMCSDLRPHLAKLEHRIGRGDFEILIYGAGMAGNVLAARLHQRYPNRTYISLGSALDPLFVGKKTRLVQVSPAAAREYFKELL
jgi:SAM-dependent methyltransferase